MIIGLTGRIAAGKGVVVDYLKEKGFEHITMSNIIAQELTLRGMEITRHHLQMVANELREHYGPGELMLRAVSQMQEGKNYIVDGIRNPAEIEELRKKEHFYLIAIDADQKLRYERFLARAKESDPKTWEEFLVYDEREFANPHNPNAQQVGECMRKADFHITNNSTLKDYLDTIDSIFEHIKK